MDERDEDTPSIADTLADRSDHADETVMRAATKAEIQELSAQMQQFGISLSDVADNCPKQQRTLLACQKALTYARENSHLLDRLVNTGRLPVAELSAGAGVERKTLERHRKYMMALMLICTNGYEIIRGHIMQVLKGGTKS